MSRRYEILDILSQGAAGVAFLAEDRESGGRVVLRRFFPFGPDGGGLNDDERAAYEIAVRRLMGISHPALRNVLDGGTDPHDGMPFVVTEWIEAGPLSARLAERPLSPPSAKALLDIALETCQILSEAFQEESVWIETATDSILLGPSDRERQVTFRISPLRWLGEDESRNGLRSLLLLAEEATGWNRRMLSDSAGDGLGAWIKALRQDPGRWTLEQARYQLHHGDGSPTAVPGSGSHAAAAIPSVRATIPAQTTPPAPRLPGRLLWPWLAVAGAVVLAALGFALWQILAPPERPSSAAPAEAGEPGTRMTAAERASARAAELAAERARQPGPPPTPAPVEASPELNRQLIEVGRQLRNQAGDIGEISGELLAVRASGSGKTLYLEFGSSSDPDAICARYRTARGTFTEDELRMHIGKRIRIRGPVVNDPSGRVAIDLADTGALSVIGE